jgi:ribosome-binding ATPase YchF (GTP1/OBG family)
MEGKTAKFFFLLVIALAVSTSRPSWAQQLGTHTPKQMQAADNFVYQDTQWSPDEDLQLLKSNIRSQKKQIIAANVDLTDVEAEKFWPVYDRYAADLARVYDTKIALLQEYLDNYQTMSGDQAESYLRRRAAVEEDIMQVRLKYVPEFRRVLTGREAALFYQIEWRLDLMVNLQLAQAPMINP